MIRPSIEILRKYFHPRKSHIYIVGGAKSGTHTMAEIWGDKIRAAHEAEGLETIREFFRWNDGEISDREMEIFLLEQDQRLLLDVNSSQLNFLFLEMLVRLFPKSKYILTIRDPYSWIDSFINHQLSYSCGPEWQRLRDFRFRPDLYTHPPEEQILKDNNLYTLDGYLSYWNHHNKKVLATVPSHRLMILHTDQINSSMEIISRFSGVNQKHMSKRNTHAFQAKSKHEILLQLDPGYLASKIKFHCGEVIETMHATSLRKPAYLFTTNFRVSTAPPWLTLRK